METTFVLRSLEIWDRLNYTIENIIVSDPPMWEVTIRKHVKSKTSQQRKYFHKILSLVCEYTGEDIETLKMQIKYRVLPLVQVTVEGEIYLHPISSEKATVKQYGELIEASLMYADAAGVSVPAADFWGFTL